MPFGYSNDIFKYPAVQYIPLQQYNTITGKYPFYDRIRFNIYRPEQREMLLKKLNQLNITQSYPLEKNQIAVLVINSYVDLVKYRGYEVLMVGRPVTGRYQLFKITDKYFYKDNLIFSLYNGEDGNRVDHESYENA